MLNYCCGPKYKYSIGKRVLNVSLTAKVINSTVLNYCCGPEKGPEERHKLKYIERKYKYSIGKRVLNVSLTAKVLVWSAKIKSRLGILVNLPSHNIEKNIFPVFIVRGKNHYSL